MWESAEVRPNQSLAWMGKLRQIKALIDIADRADGYSLQSKNS